MSKYRAIKGFKDILPEQIPVWHYIENEARRLFESFGFSEMRVPVLEYTELFARGIGEATDIVEKEMYTFQDRDGKMVTLRPEGTAGIVRAYIENMLYRESSISRFYYVGQMYRHERPQAGRLRQFHQIGAELLGSKSPYVDAEIIYMLYCFVKNLKLPDIKIYINTLGCAQCRPVYREALVAFFETRKEELCETCQHRLKINPLRILDCKRETCGVISSGAPRTTDHLCGECATHFDKVTATLVKLGADFELNSRIVRGLDYYTRTTFEIVSLSGLGSQNAIAAGGRYDGLISSLGGPDVSGIGFALGVERLVMLLSEFKPAVPKKIFIAAIGEEAKEYILPLAFSLKTAGMQCEMEYEDRNLKTLMKKADQSNAGWTIIIGEEELKNSQAIIRNMHTKSQTTLKLPADAKNVIDALLEE